MSEDLGRPRWERQPDDGGGAGQPPTVFETGDPSTIKACLSEAYQTGRDPAESDMQRRRLHCWTPPMDADVAAEVVRDALPEAYNEFDRDRVADLLDDLQAPAGVRIGREYSPVVYVAVESDDDHEELEALVHEHLAGHRAAPQEYTTKTDENGTEWVRMWWD